MCQNTVGGFVCQCKEGFTRDNDGTTCERMLTLMYIKSIRGYHNNYVQPHYRLHDCNN